MRNTVRIFMLPWRIFEIVWAFRRGDQKRRKLRRNPLGSIERSFNDANFAFLAGNQISIMCILSLPRYHDRYNGRYLGEILTRIPVGIPKERQ